MVGERVQEIVDSAERVAEEIRTEAETSAASYLRERRREADRLVEEGTRELAERTRVLSERAERLWREATELAAEFRQAATSLEDEDRAQPAMPEPAPEGPPESGRRRAPGDAVLRATQLAVAGRDRDEIVAAIASEFALDDPGALVEEVLDLTRVPRT